MTVVDLIRLHEGLRLSPYVDATGHTTIGWGHNLTADPLPPSVFGSDGSISIGTAAAVLSADIAVATMALVTNCTPWFQALDTVRQAVIQDMCFNLGWHGLSEFHHTLGFVASGDYDAAADAMLASEPWASQVGSRAVEDATMMRSGEWPTMPN
jgi:lysozyme